MNVNILIRFMGLILFAVALKFVAEAALRLLPSLAASSPGAMDRATA